MPPLNHVMIDYHNKIFRPVSNSENGEVDEHMHFHYKQSGNIVTCSYSGKKITSGHLLALVEPDGSLEMRYHQVNILGEIMTGICRSSPEVMKNGKIRLIEKWKWTSGDFSSGASILEEQ